MREPLTAEDVTDEMVRELLRTELSVEDSCAAETVLGGFVPGTRRLITKRARRAARTRIAELLNARRGK